MFVIEDKINAAGNDILVNDNGALVHPHLTDETLKEIEDIFKVPVHRGTIGSLDIVGMAAVVSIPDDTFQEIGIAYVMPSGSTPLTESDLLAHARTHLANYKIPKRLFVVEEMPMLPIGKVDKVALTKRSIDDSD